MSPGVRISDAALGAPIHQADQQHQVQHDQDHCGR